MDNKKNILPDRFKNNPDIPLTMQEKFSRAVRTGLQAVPYGIGSAIVEAVFGTIDERRRKKIEAFIRNLAEDIEILKDRLKTIDKSFFATDEFSYYSESILKRVSAEIQKEKLAALRGALVSLIVEPIKFSSDKINHFIRAIDVLDATHIHVLKFLSARHSRPEIERYLNISEICRILKATNEADQNFIYSSIDTLANKEFVVSGRVPFDPKGKIDKQIQRFKCTALGMEFLDFIRMNKEES